MGLNDIAHASTEKLRARAAEIQADYDAGRQIDSREFRTIERELENRANAPKRRAPVLWARSNRGDTSHGTTDRQKTLCGIEVGGTDGDVLYDPDSGFACGRCNLVFKRNFNRADR